MQENELKIANLNQTVAGQDFEEGEEHMHTFETKIQELKTAVLTEVARLTWEDRLQTGILDVP